jgi:hypothetical protein
MFLELFFGIWESVFVGIGSGIISSCYSAGLFLLLAGILGLGNILLKTRSSEECPSIGIYYLSVGFRVSALIICFALVNDIECLSWINLVMNLYIVESFGVLIWEIGSELVESCRSYREIS